MRSHHKNRFRPGVELLEARDVPTHLPVIIENREYVTAIYRDLLSREPDVEGLANFTLMLDRGADRDTVALQIINSLEFTRGFVNEGYRRYLGRSPSPSEINPWVGFLVGGGDFDVLEARIISSDEAYVKAGGTDRTWLESLYQKALGRAIGAEELRNGLTALGSGVGRFDVSLEVLNSVEADRLTVKESYFDILSRDPRETALDNRTLTPAISEGASATLTGVIVQAHSVNEFILEIHWGDGTPFEILNLPAGSGGREIRINHRYADDGVYPVIVSWGNQFGEGNAADFTVHVQNVAPVVNAGTDGTATPGGVLNRAGTFRDPGADRWTATVDYGDGSGVQELRLHDDRFFLHHRYERSGSYTVTVTVRDDDNGVGIARFRVTVRPPRSLESLDAMFALLHEDEDDPR